MGTLLNCLSGFLIIRSVFCASAVAYHHPPFAHSCHLPPSSVAHYSSREALFSTRAAFLQSFRHVNLERQQRRQASSQQSDVIQQRRCCEHVSEPA